MTYAEAIAAAQQGKRVTHPGINRGWCVVWRDKQVMYLNYLNEHAKLMACKVEDREKKRTDWSVVK